MQANNEIKIPRKPNRSWLFYISEIVQMITRWRSENEIDLDATVIRLNISNYRPRTH